MKVGVVKVVPPATWAHRTPGEIDDSLLRNIWMKDHLIQNIDIETPPTSKLVYGYITNEFRNKDVNLLNFKNEFIENHNEITPTEYWDNIGTKKNIIYGADVDGTLFEPSLNKFNLNKLGTILNKLPIIRGIQSPYLYCGFNIWLAHRRSKSVFN